jgi:hypothetical protein
VNIAILTKAHLALGCAIVESGKAPGKEPPNGHSSLIAVMRREFLAFGAR